MDDFRTALIMVVFLFTAGIVVSTEGQNTTENYYKEILSGTQEITTLGPKNDTSPRCRDICECFSQSLGNSSLSPACFRIKGNSSHLVKQMRQENSYGRSCQASGDTVQFQCEGTQMTCAHTGGATILRQDFAEDPLSDFFSSSANESAPGTPSSDRENPYTYMTCEQLSGGDGSILSCRIEKNATMPGICEKETLTKCHYKSAGNKQKKESSRRDNEVSRNDKCPQGWSFRRKRCHRYFDEPLTFDLAYARCREMGAFLTLGSEGASDELLPQKWDDSTHWAQNKTEGNKTSMCSVINSNHSYSETSCAGPYPFYCYKEVFKFLQCKAVPVKPTKMTTTEKMTTTVETTTMTPPTAKYHLAPVASSPEKKVNNARRALGEAKVQIEDFVSHFTDDPATLEILEDIIDAPPMTVPEEPGSNDAAVSMVTEMVEKMDNLVDSLAEVVSRPGKSLVIENDDLVLKVIPICTTCSSTSPGLTLKAGINNDSYVVRIPSSATGDGATAAISALGSIEDVMSSNMVDDDEETITSSENRTVVTHEIVSLVATVSVKKWDGSDLQLAADQPFEIIFTNRGSAVTAEGSGHSCCYWQPDALAKGEGAWSTEGCVTKVNRTHTSCHCTHLTSFAVLMRITKAGEPQSAHVTKIQDYMTYVGCGLSMTCLATMLIVFTMQKLYRSDRNIIHMNLASALLVSQALFLFGIERVEILQVCKTIGICLHFFLLATFFWMLVEGIYLISKTTSTKNKFLKMPTYIAIGWGGPAIIVGITAGVSFKSYSIEKICWLSNEDGGIWAFVGPAIGIIMMNVSLLCQVIRVFLSLKTNMKKAHVDRIWLALRAMLLTLPLLGGTWLFGILSFNSQTIFFSYIFIVLNSLQGVFIFVLYCVMNDEVKKVVEKKLSSISRISGRASNARSTRSTT